MTNAEILLDYIKSQQAGDENIALNIEWVEWALKYLASAEKLNARINIALNIECPTYQTPRYVLEN